MDLLGTTRAGKKSGRKRFDPTHHWKDHPPVFQCVKTEIGVRTLTFVSEETSLLFSLRGYTIKDPRRHHIKTDNIINGGLLYSFVLGLNK